MKRSPSMRLGAVIGTLAAVGSLIWLVVSVYPHDAPQAAPGAIVHAQPAARPVPSTATPTPAPRPRAKPKPAPPNPCAGNQGQAVLVSIAQQRVWLCDNQTTDAEYPVTTGRNGDETPTGNYDVQALTRDTTLNPSTGGAYPVQYWIPFKWGMFGFHDASWQQIPFGSPQYAQAGSQGCVHMRTADIAHLFGWVHLGTRVRVS